MKTSADVPATKIGIALGGGGARGFAHLGVVQALIEKGIRPHAYAGVSAGAMVGAFLASGFEPHDILEKMKATGIGDYAKVIVPINGLLDLGNLEKQLRKHLDTERIEDLSIPFHIGVTNLHSGESEYHSRGPLLQFVQASASIPVLFEPVEIDGVQYVDGGLMDNIPIEPLREYCDKVIAINISPVQRIDRVKNLLETAARTFQLTVNNRTASAREESDLFIEPEGLADFSLLDTSNADELFELGYHHTRAIKKLSLDKTKTIE